MPDRRTGKAADNLDSELFGRARGFFLGLDRPGALGFRIALAFLWGKGIRPIVIVQIASELARKVVRDRPDIEAVFGQQFSFLLAVIRLIQGLIDLHVVSPAGQLQTVIAEILGLLAHGFQGQIRPLAGKKS